MPNTYAYLVDPYDLDRLRDLATKLHGGTDKERDTGHIIWLIVNSIADAPITKAEMDAFDSAAKYVADTCESLLNGE